MNRNCTFIYTVWKEIIKLPDAKNVKEKKLKE